MMRVLVIPPAGEVQELEVPATVAAVSELMGGAFITPVSGVFDLPSESLEWMAWVDEDGLPRDLPVNHRATSLVVQLGRPDLAWPLLVGTVVLSGRLGLLEELAESVPPRLLRAAREVVATV